ncbi:hypothetical protein KDA14_01980 [Candidatus Saccharibacteria bacterium]|nr:hypothetical protein [Candidatus Saccharibacteria bacterium]
MDDGETTDLSNRWDHFLIELQPRQLAQIALAGAIAGVAVWLLTLLIRQVILVPIFCGNPANAACVGATDIAGIFATIIAAVIGLMGLVRIGAFRPLLIVIAAAISLWGLSSWVSGLFIGALVWSVVLYTLTYAAFAWFVRIRPFVPALLVVVFVVFLARVLAIV